MNEKKILGREVDCDLDTEQRNGIIQVELSYFQCPLVRIRVYVTQLLLI